MSNIFVKVLEILSSKNPSREAIYSVFTLLDDYTCNDIHDFIFDNLFEYLEKRNKKYLLAARGMCIQQIYRPSQQ